MDVTSKKKLPLIKKRKTLIGLLQLTTDTWRDEKLTLRVFCLALGAFALGVFVLH